MKKLIQRLLVFIAGLPLIFAIVYFLPHYNQLALNIAVVVSSALGALEFSLMLKKKNLVISRAEALVLGALGPAAMTAASALNLDCSLLYAVFLGGVSWLLISGIFYRAETLDRFTGRLCAGFCVLIYPGLFMEWIIRMGLFEKSREIILVFLAMVFANDSLAWASGMLFGKGNRGVIPASPNKSAAGFIGGTAASVLAGAWAALCLPGVFIPRRVPALAAGMILGLLSGAAASLGDLGESAIKRSSGIKDSGFIIPGRGGMLDSIDSIALAAPVFYHACRILFVQSQL
ncbi:MAG: phosphatidate cytidylyltransferase [Treponema sp.]|jgi:phosphatidate cytidylyltransferase|nr:phosphatidate cytidylyltransferase [Treponema sp.]